MSYYLAVVFSLTVSIAVLIGWIRFSKIGPVFYNFIFLITIALLNEMVGMVLSKIYQSNAVSINIYSLLEGLIITWQFKRWGLFRRKTLFYFLFILLPAVWCFEVFYLSSLFEFTSYFIIVNCLVIVLLSISMINKLLVTDSAPLLTNSIFLICMCFITLYTYNALIEVFWIYGLDASRSFRLYIYRIFYFINLLTNLTYALAVLWIPKKREFIVLS